MGAVLIVLVLIGFFVTLAIKMVPAYMGFLQVRSVMERVASKPELLEGGPRAVLAGLDRQLGIDGIRSVGPSDFRVERDGADLILHVDYDVQKHIAFNVDVVMHFAHSLPLARP
jgi:hypothetical protein